MRRLSESEKNLVRIINSGNGNNIQNLIDHILVEVVIEIIWQNNGKADVNLKFNVDNPLTLTHEESENLIKRVNSINLEIITAINLLNLLSKEGYIIIYQKANVLSRGVSFGQGVVNLASVDYSFSDKDVADLLAEFVKKEIIATVELSEFVKHNFLARDEQRYSKQVLISTIALCTAIFAALTNLGFNVWRDFYKPSAETTINQSQIKELQSGIHSIKISNDSLNITAKKTLKVISKGNLLNTFSRKDRNRKISKHSN